MAEKGKERIKLWEEGKDSYLVENKGGKRAGIHC